MIYGVWRSMLIVYIKDTIFDVLKDSLFAYQYDECGVTQYEGEQTTGKKYVVFIDMHS